MTRRTFLTSLVKRIHSLPIGTRAFFPRFLWNFRAPENPASQASPHAAIGAGGLLESIGEKHRPTKRNHDYLRHYDTHLGLIREKVKNVVEVGVQTEASLMMWEEFFPHATIWGVDIDPECAKLSGGRKRVRIGDQSDAVFLGELAAEISQEGGIDVVIDDGSHMIDHQMITFETLFPLMNSHAIYVIEDTGGVVGDHTNFVRRSSLKLTEGIFSWPRNVDPKDWETVASLGEDASWWARHVTGVAVYRWLIFVMKGRNPEDNPHLGS